MRQRQGRELPDAEPFARRDHLRLRDPPQHRIVRLVGDQRHPVLGGERTGPHDLLGGPLGGARVQDLALAHQIGQRQEGFLERCPVVEPLELVDVEVVGLQPVERGVQRGDEVLAAQPGVVAPWSVRPEHAAAQHEPVAALTVQCLRQRALGVTVAPGSGRGEQVDPGVERGVDAGRGGLDVRW